MRFRAASRSLRALSLVSAIRRLRPSSGVRSSFCSWEIRTAAPLLTVRSSEAAFSYSR